MLPARGVWIEFYGYDDAGGHMHGYGWIHDKPEFPDDWDEKKILGACIDTMRSKVSAIAASSGGRKDTNLVVDGKPIRVAITWDTDKKRGKCITSFFPAIDGR
ncbi:hypothetical protein ACLUWU_00895 [Bifidobacterium thermophilum]|uniref:hypothetical protein n=1 Tax=Bifidobacterium thermophilum TaxID=33905 RepID=UPI0039966768